MSNCISFFFFILTGYSNLNSTKWVGFDANSNFIHWRLRRRQDKRSSPATCQISYSLDPLTLYDGGAARPKGVRRYMSEVFFDRSKKRGRRDLLSSITLPRLPLPLTFSKLTSRTPKISHSIRLDERITNPVSEYSLPQTWSLFIRFSFPAQCAHNSSLPHFLNA